MSDCCNPSGYQRLFDSKEARRTLRSYEKKGLNKMAARVVDYLKSRNVEGHTVLEVGGGIGACHVELLKAGAANATNIELSEGYEQVAKGLLKREGLEGRAERRIGDFTEMAADLEADHVIMNRVICCYPYMERLMSAALSSSKHFLAVTFPRDRPIFRFFVGMGNAFCRIRGVDFQAFIHPPQAILDRARQGGFTVVFNDHDFIWHGVVFERTA